MGHPTTEERRKRLFEIMEQISQLNKEADSILEEKSLQKTSAAAKSVILPNLSDFNQTEAVKGVIISHPQGIQKKQIIKAIKSEYGVELTPLQAQSVLAYLKNTKKEIQSAGYGRYKAI